MIKTSKLDLIKINRKKIKSLSPSPNTGTIQNISERLLSEERKIESYKKKQHLQLVRYLEEENTRRLSEEKRLRKIELLRKIHEERQKKMKEMGKKRDELRTKVKEVLRGREKEREMEFKVASARICRDSKDRLQEEFEREIERQREERMRSSKREQEYLTGNMRKAQIWEMETDYIQTKNQEIYIKRKFNK